MKIYKISFDYDYALADAISSKGIADSLDLSADTPELIDKFTYGWITTESDRIPDIGIINTNLLAIDNVAMQALQSHGISVTLSPIKIGELNYYIIIKVPRLRDCLNLKKSKLTRFSTGEIMNVSKAVLLPGDYPAIFQIDEMPSDYFVTEEFKMAIHNVTGLIYEEIKIKSNSWFK